MESVNELGQSKTGNTVVRTLERLTGKCTRKRMMNERREKEEGSQSDRSHTNGQISGENLVSYVLRKVQKIGRLRRCDLSIECCIKGDCLFFSGVGDCINGQ